MRGICKTSIIIFFIILTTNISLAHFSKYIVKHWDTDQPLSSWVFKWFDQWGGSNYQCCGEVIEDCHFWSWKAIYPLENIIDPDPCPQNNNVDYGENLSRYEAVQQGKSVPEEAVFVFSIEEIINPIIN